MHWDQELGAKLRSLGFSIEQIGIVIGEVAEHRQIADREGYKRGFNSGHYEAETKRTNPQQPQDDPQIELEEEARQEREPHEQEVKEIEEAKTGGAVECPYCSRIVIVAERGARCPNCRITF